MLCSIPSGSARQKRQLQDESSPLCSVQQLPGRHPKDPAYQLSFNAEDEDSDLQTSYAVGDSPGTTNVLPWAEMRGTSIIVPTTLPCEKPLYFQVKVRNTEGLETTAHCSLPIYDCSEPGGQVDAAYSCTSHPNRLDASVVIYENSELIEAALHHGLGFSPSTFGHEVVNWQPLILTRTNLLAGESTDLRYFTDPRPGRLSAAPLETTNKPNAEACAAECVRNSKCLTFAYNAFLNTCELQSVREGADVRRQSDSQYVTYEKLGMGRSTQLNYEHVKLRHGTMYYVNVEVENSLGYRALLSSRGTMADRTPPVTGYLGEGATEVIVADRCNASVIQRCVDVIDTPNHR